MLFALNNPRQILNTLVALFIISTVPSAFFHPHKPPTTNLNAQLCAESASFVPTELTDVAQSHTESSWAFEQEITDFENIFLVDRANHTCQLPVLIYRIPFYDSYVTNHFILLRSSIAPRAPPMA